MSRPVAIIGAGIAGLATARRLRQAGLEAVVVEKSRGLGGRMATRRTEAGPFDHGAQFFTARGAQFVETLDQWIAAGCADRWHDDAFVGSPAMSAPARHLAGDTPVTTGCEIARLSRAPTGWTLHTRMGPADLPANGKFAAVALAVPAPQALPLAASAGVGLPGLAEARLAPCWALMLALDQPLTGFERHVKPQHPAIAWIADNASKPGRSLLPRNYVVHATPGWSREHLELTPEEAGRMLLGHLNELLGPGIVPALAVAHRWRYALVEQTAGERCLWDATAQLGACGDWCLGPRIECAFDSGEAMAQAVIATLGGRHDA